MFIDYVKYFNSIICEFNGIKTELTSELAFQILKLYVKIIYPQPIKL